MATKRGVLKKKSSRAGQKKTRARVGRPFVPLAVSLGSPRARARPSKSRQPGLENMSLQAPGMQDLESSLAGTGILTLLLDDQLRLQQFSPANGGLFSLDLSQVGKPIDRLKKKLHYAAIAADAAQVLDSGLPMERQVQDQGGKWFLVRWLPYPATAGSPPSLLLTIIDITSLHHAEIEQHRQSEEQLRELSQRLTYHVDNSPLAVIEWGPDMRLIRWSGAAERIFGWKVEEVLGKRISDFRWVYDEDVSRVTEVSVDLQTGSNPHRFSSNRNYRKDGSIIHCEWYNSSLVDESGQLRSILSLVLDVTDRIQAEEALRESRRKYQDMLETTSDFIWEIDSQGRYTYCSPQLRTMAGLEPADLLGKTPFDVMPPEERTRILPIFSEITEKGRSFRGLTSTAYNSRGELIHIETSGVPFFDSQDRLLGYRGITRDITERHKAEKQLETSSQKQKEILESIQDDFYVLDRDWVFVYASPLFTSKVGKKPEDFTGRIIWDLFPKHVGTTLEENFRACMEKREVRRFEISGKYTNAWYRITCFPSAEGITVIGTDITGQRKVEEALREKQQELALLNETLELRVREQTTELRRLASDLTRAEHRERHRISHILHDDLQQRLYAIQMQIEFLPQAGSDDGQVLKDELMGIKKQLAEVLSLTRHLSIDLSPPILRDEGLSQAIGWLTTQMRDQHGLEVELQADQPFALHDEDMQVLLFNCVRELLFNVVKHSGVNRAEVSLTQVEEGLRIEVCDRGRGFAADPSTASLHDSTPGEEDPQASFGLPTIRHRLSLFGGRMEINSNPGEGTLITMTIPLKHEPEGSS